jgi:hypothetical protein
MLAKPKRLPAGSRRHLLLALNLAISLGLLVRTDSLASDGDTVTDPGQRVKVAGGDPFKDVNVSLSIEEVMDRLNGQPDAVLDEAEQYYNYARHNVMLGNFYDAGKLALKMVEQHRKMGSRPVEFAVLFERTDIRDCVYRPNIVAYGISRARAGLDTRSMSKEEVDWVCRATGEKIADRFLRDPKPQIQLVDGLVVPAIEDSRREYEERKGRPQKQ